MDFRILFRKWFIFVFAVGLIFIYKDTDFAYAKSVSSNELGMIPVLEYHHVGPEESRWTRSYENFRRDLEWLYNNDYRAVSIADFAAQNIAIPVGKKPVIFTFDDSTDSQIGFDEKGNVLPDTAVGIMDAFLKEHSDFGSAAVFYVNRKFFPATADKKKIAEYLVRTGREVQNHTASHADLSKISFEELESELTWFEPFLRDFGAFEHSFSIAYPFGGVPKNDGFAILNQYAGMGFLVGADPAFPPYHAKYDAFRIPRIQAIDEEWKRWFRRSSGGVEYQKEAEVFTPFVSDGQPDVLTVLDEKLLKRDAVRTGLTVRVEEVYPYEACDDPNAEKFLDYKRNGLSAKMAAQLNVSNFSVMLPQVFYQWFRQEILFEKPSGIYLTSNVAGGELGRDLTDRLRKSEGTMIVFDVKETPGIVAYWATLGGRERKPHIQDLKKYVHELQEKGIYVTARIVVFKDQYMTALQPDLAIQRAGGGVWKDDRGVPWLDPSNEKVQDYIIRLAREVAEAGVDEIQYDYVRFPTEGDLRSARYKNVGAEKWLTIRDFLHRSREALMPYGVKLSADVFGIVGWNKGYDAKSTGQKIECISPYLDVIYPMGYPSHFGPGFAGYKNPADKPYDFVYKTTKFFVDFAKGTLTDIRPWLQAFTYRITIPYNTDYIRQQIKAGEDAGGNGFALWNAGNRYDVTWGAF